VRILVIDDEPLVAGVMAEALQSEGNDVIVAGSGQEGLRAIEDSLPDAVFLDIVMPGLDGIATLRRIREKAPDLPVIILTGGASESQLDEARTLGVTEIIWKPVALKNLTRALAQS